MEVVEVKSPLTAEAEVKQFTLVSDDIYMKRYSDATIPDWYRNLIDNIITNSQTASDVAYLTTYVSQLEEGYNTAITNLESADASLLSTQESLVTTEDSATAIVTDIVQSYIDGGNANSWFTNQITTYADYQSAMATQLSSLGTIVDGHTVSIDNVDTLIATETEWLATASKLITDDNGYITGWSFVDGSNVESSFNVYATNFKITDSATEHTPFSISGNNIQFNGVVSFTNVDGFETAVQSYVEQVQVGDKNINITDNLIPTTSLTADTNNSGYQFIGNPVKSNQAGIDTFSESQVVIDSDDEVYTPYIDELAYSYYYRFGITGITDLSSVQIISITDPEGTPSTDVQNLTVVLNDGITLSSSEWYIVDGIVNPTNGDNTSYSGSIRTADGTKIGTIQNLVFASGASWFVIGWVNNCTISRMKIARITADTTTGSLASTDYVDTGITSITDNIYYPGTTTIDGGNIYTGSITAQQINTTGLIADDVYATDFVGKNIYGAYIEGAVIKASYLDLDGELQVLTNYHLWLTQADMDAGVLAGQNGELYTNSTEMPGAIFIGGSPDEYRLPSISSIHIYGGPAPLILDETAPCTVNNQQTYTCRTNTTSVPQNINRYDSYDLTNNSRFVKRLPTFNIVGCTLMSAGTSNNGNYTYSNIMPSHYTLSFGGLLLGFATASLTNGTNFTVSYQGASAVTYAGERTTRSASVDMYGLTLTVSSTAYYNTSTHLTSYTAKFSISSGDVTLTSALTENGGFKVTYTGGDICGQPGTGSGFTYSYDSLVTLPELTINNML
jgi:hypothetical protein